MTFFPVSLKALAILAVAALAGIAVALTRSKSIDIRSPQERAEAAYDRHQ